MRCPIADSDGLDEARSLGALDFRPALMDESTTDHAPAALHFLLAGCTLRDGFGQTSLIYRRFSFRIWLEFELRRRPTGEIPRSSVKTRDARVSRVPVSLTRVLVLLLAFRAVIAPLTYRPANSNPSHRNGIVLSVRWWPPQRLQRFSGTSKLLRLFRGKNEVVPDGEVRLQRVVARWFSPRLHPALIAPCLSSPLRAVRLTTFLRC